MKDVQSIYAIDNHGIECDLLSKIRYKAKNKTQQEKFETDEIHGFNLSCLSPCKLNKIDNVDVIFLQLKTF